MSLPDEEIHSPPRLCGDGRKLPLLLTVNLEEELPQTHPVRGIWRAVAALDWGDYHRQVRSRGRRAGRPALDPRALATLWIWGLREGVPSARALARRCETDWACCWALGGVRRVSHHTLSDFLRDGRGALDGLLSQTIAALHECGAVSFDTLLADGTKASARASYGSFHDEAGLSQAVSRKLSALRSRGTGETKREQSARQRAERELLERYDQAVAMLRSRQSDLRAEGPKAVREKSGQVRASLSEAEARVMRCADGGSQPAMNVQLGCCAKSGAVLCVWATDRGGDRGLGERMVREMERQCGQRPRRLVADGGYGGLRDAAAVRALAVDYVVPPRAASSQPSRRAGLRGSVRAAEAWWRELWAEHEGWARRARLRVEHVIGAMKGRGLRRMPSYGLAAATRWARWQALMHNLLLWLRVRG